ncbi:hypothetical protein [Pseudonocardia sp. NPDC049635]|uniref:AtuA-related protein n=1 Tax=Pseudonocardia sp. NPDC049635 TaxID=3155506 RepID=UPI0033D9FD4E
MRVDDVADVRAGDKGDTLMLAVLPRDEAGWALLREQLTGAAVRRHFGPAVTGPVDRYEVPGLPALVFRLPGALGGGVTGSLTLDGHGKALSYHLLTLELEDRGGPDGR